MASGTTNTALKNDELLLEAYAGNLRRLKELARELDDGKGMAKTIAGVKDSRGITAIHLAAIKGNLNVIKYLIGELKLDVNVQETQHGRTPLQCAIIQSQLSIAFYLLKRGADPGIVDETGHTALHYAAEIGDMSLLRLLLSRGGTVDAISSKGTPLEKAALSGKHEAVELLLQHRANPNLTYRDVCSPLLASILANSMRCMQLLLKAGADPNYCGFGPTPLELVALEGQADMVLPLLKAGADPNITNEEGLKPIEVAAVTGYNRVVEILLPKTEPVSVYSKWSVGGIMQHVHSKEAKAQRVIIQDVKFGEAKLRGDKAFREKDYTSATYFYSKAISGDPDNVILHSNRSLCYLRLKDGRAALQDAMRCVMLRTDWPKSFYRLGSAFHLLQDYEHATEAFLDGLKFDPENQELKKAYQEAVEAKSKTSGLFSNFNRV
ncbi:hypothetical protein ACHQM5_027332 [Ranunculus cassubicifolius]